MNNPAFYYGQGGPQLGGAGRGMPSGQMGGPPPHYMQQATFRNMPPGAGIPPDPAAMQQQPPPQQHHHHRSKRQSNKGAGALVEDTDEPSGDELDDISARDIAMARYKRNHDYLSEIFTPYSAASIVPPPLEIPQSKEDITESIENEEKAINERTTKFEERLQALKQKQEDYWKLLGQLEKANDLEQFDESTKKFKKATGISLEHIKENVQSVPIPGLEQDEPPLVQQPQSSGNSDQQQHNSQQQPQQHRNGFVADFMNARVAAAGGNGNGTSSNGDIPSSGSMNMFGSYGTANSNTNQPVEDDNQNDFFDEMVNTGQDDDGGSVSEFLNSDMDFEQATTTENKPSESTQQHNTSEDATMTEATDRSLSAIANMEQDTPAVSSSSAPTQLTTLNSTTSISASVLPDAQQPLAQVQAPSAQSSAQQETQQFQTQVQVSTEQITSQTAPTQTSPQTVPDASTSSFTGQPNEENSNA
ncbi:hypothetical protein BDC45DRAFT_508973 [Circinella umbellata]|nr:hypothetical protein BDC45DRAFT_508973 [Circinella umbellata]